MMICGPQYDFLAQKPYHLSELTTYPLISLVRDTSTYTFYSRLYMQQNLIFEPEIEAATASQILPMIENGLGIGFIPQSLGQTPLSEKKILKIPLLEEIPAREIILAEDTSRPMSIAANSLSAMLRNHASPI